MNKPPAPRAPSAAVAAFLESRIRFDQIQDVNRATLDSMSFSAPTCLDALLALDASSRSQAEQSILKMS